MKANTTKWYAAQIRAQNWLRAHHIRTVTTDWGAPFDLYTPKGTRIEIKFSPFLQRKRKTNPNGTKPAWVFNIHRHGELKESKVDFYILVCEPTPETARVGLETNIHLVIPSPIGAPAIQVSIRSLLRKWGAFADNLQALRDFDLTRTTQHKTDAVLQAQGMPKELRSEISRKAMAIRWHGKVIG